MLKFGPFRRPRAFAQAAPSAVPFALALVALLASPVGAEPDEGYWPQFRGPGARGIAPEGSTFPETWSPEENVAWKVPLPGLGWSSPVIWKDRVFVTSCVPEGEIEAPQKGLYFGGERPTSTAVHHWSATCIDLNTGEVVWTKDAFVGPPPTGKHLKNTYASETPVTDGNSVWVYFGNVGMARFDFDGNLVWKKSFEPHETFNQWGTGASPVLHEGRIYVVCDNQEASYMVALDAETGAQIWRVERPDEKSNWVTPFVWVNDVRTEIVTCGLVANRSYDLDGKLLWTLKGMSQPTVPTPFAADGLLYISSGWVMDKFKPVYAVRPGAEGDITLAKGQTSNESIVWFTDKVGAYHPSALVIDGLYYTLHDQGFFLCNDAKTGEVVYGKQRISKGSAGFTCSPWALGDRIFVQNEDGETYVIKAGREFEVLGKNTLDEFSMATPAIAKNSLVIRTANHVWRIAEKK